MAKILVIDDELGIRDLLCEILSDEGHQVDAAENAATAKMQRIKESYDLILLDIWMPDTDGITLLKDWSSSGQLTVPVIMMSGHATIDTAVQATKLGALSFLEKPITLQKLLTAVERGLNASALSRLPPHPGVMAINSMPTVGAETTIEQAMMQGAYSNSQFPAIQLPGAAQSFNLNLPLRDAKDLFEMAYFEYHLAHERGSVSRVAEKTGIERTHLYRKLKQLGLDGNRKGKN